MTQMPELLQLIMQFGVLPLLLLLVYFMYKYILEINKRLISKDEEIRAIEKENVGLLYKCLAALEKITKKDEK